MYITFKDRPYAIFSVKKKKNSYDFVYPKIEVVLDMSIKAAWLMQSHIFHLKWVWLQSVSIL